MVTLGRKRQDAVLRAIGEIAANFRTSRPAISKHLRLLCTVGLVATTRKGTARICALNAEPLRAVGDWISDYGHTGARPCKAETLCRGGAMTTVSADNVVIKEIAIKAPARRTFEALTNPDQRKEWWGTEGRF